MSHGNATPPCQTADPVAQRIANLSREYLSAPPQRQAEIGTEIAAMIDGRVVVLGR